ncbi:potassium/proton antiporter [Paenibacillus sp. HN-1]|uniref:potassium/proton antiporter n=1 Tax=Paenibacillus TaxID=44249 RepID=UPI001CA8D57A|nr:MULTISPECIES: potassium/proton antiporter [Paenibacillus]MBY9081308.1 potassium/proton antiporter [Paenibacillus sp. CGMCC 1.18879]MBY9087581.1 potassium/proton antiporter [Paenibacillus sinensis]
MTHLADSVIMLLAALLLIGVLSTKFSSRFGMPSLVLFIAAGMILSRFIYYDNVALTQMAGIFALVIILFEGGMQTSFKDIKPVIGPSLVLSTLGVLVTTGVVGLAATYILGVSWEEGLLFGAIVGSTDAAAVFSVLGGKNIDKRLTSTLEAESGSNDPMAVFLTVSLIEWIESPETGLWSLLLSFVWEMAVGLLVGLLVGRIAIYLINKINLDSTGLYPVVAVGFAVLTYGSAALLHSSGLLAVYVMGLVLGNSEIVYHRTIMNFNHGFAWMMQIFMFILLGLLVFPQELTHVALQGLLLSVILMIAARPIAVFLSLLFFKYSGAEKILIAWAGLRGAVPIVLATYPLLSNLENGRLFFNVVFFVVLTSAVIQGTTISPLAARLKLAGGQPEAPSLMELVALGRTDAEFNHVRIQPDMPIAGMRISDMQLSDEILFTAIIRDDKIVTPHGYTVIEPGDVLYVLSPKSKREEMKSLFRVPESG